MTVWPTSPFLRSTSPRPADIYTDATVDLLRRQGVDVWSVRAVATWMQLTPSAILMRHSRVEVVTLVVATFGNRWLDWCRAPLHGDLPARLPETDDERHGVRVWRALQELARGARAAGHPTAEEQVRAVRADERAQADHDLARRLERPARPEELETTMALTAGLRSELTAPGTQLTAEAANDLLARHVRQLREQG